MAILLELKPDIEARLQAEAEANGLPLADFAGRLIAEYAAVPQFRTSEEMERRLMSLAKECQDLPLLDRRSADEIIGYDNDGLPYR